MTNKLKLIKDDTMPSVKTEDIMLNLVYPHGPTRSRELKTLPGSDVLYHDSRSLKVYGVPDAHRDSFMNELIPSLSRDEKEMVNRYNAEAALVQLVVNEDSHVGIIAWSNPGRLDSEGGQAVPLSGAPAETEGSPATQLLYYIYRGKNREQLLETIDLAVDMLEHQWPFHVGTKLAAADARLYEVSPSCFRGSIPPEEDTMPVACYSLEFEPENTGSTERRGTARLPVPAHLVPSFRETVGGMDLDGPAPLSYPFDAALASAFMVAASGGKRIGDVIKFVRRLSPALHGPLGIAVTADPHHLKQDLLDACGDQYIPFFLIKVEDWLRDHRDNLPESLHPDTPGALKMLFNLACILHDAGAPYE